MKSEVNSFSLHFLDKDIENFSKYSLSICDSSLESCVSGLLVRLLFRYAALCIFIVLYIS